MVTLKLFVVANLLSISMTGSMPGSMTDLMTNGQLYGPLDGPLGGRTNSQIYSPKTPQITGRITGQLSGWMDGGEQIDSFEKQALSSVQEMSASDLDARLAGRPFIIWINQIIGPKAGVVWQLTECGEKIDAPNESGHDLLACAEINASLPDGRRVFVAINVGTFKKGLNGKPAFFSAVIEQNLQLFPVRRLSQLPEMLRSPLSLSKSLAEKRPATSSSNKIVEPLMIKAVPPRIVSPVQDDYVLSLAPDVLPPLEKSSEPPPPPL